MSLPATSCNTASRIELPSGMTTSKNRVWYPLNPRGAVRGLIPERLALIARFTEPGDKPLEAIAILETCMEYAFSGALCAIHLGSRSVRRQVA